MSTIAVVDVITQYLMTFGPLLGDIKKEGFIPLSLDRLSIVFNIAVKEVSVSSTQQVQYYKQYQRSCYQYPIVLIQVVQALRQTFLNQNSS